MSIASILENVKIVSQEKGYWFVRTDSGRYFNDYTDNNYIAIGWNEITTKDLRQMTESGNEIKSKISESQESDDAEISQRQLKARTTGIFTKILRFKNLKRGDLVIVPSSSSMTLAFGIIQDEDIYTETDKATLLRCPFEKRRVVKWVESKPLAKLDPIFYQIIKSRHSICDIKKYDSYIDNVTETLYIKDDYTHFVININTEDAIELDKLLLLINTINTLNKEINTKLTLPSESNEILIRLNLQSPGRIELKSIGNGLVILALLFSSCASDDTTKNSEVNNLIQIEDAKLKDIDRVIKELELDKEKLKRIK